MHRLLRSISQAGRFAPVLGVEYGVDLLEMPHLQHLLPGGTVVGDHPVDLCLGASVDALDALLQVVDHLSFRMSRVCGP